MQLPAQQQLNCRDRTPQRLCFSIYPSFQPLPLRHATSLPRPRQCCPHTPGAAAAPQDHQHASTSISSTNSSSSSSSHCWWSRLDWELLLLVSALPPVPTALAEEGLKYDSSRGEGIVKTLSGALYIGLLLYFLFKVLNRRARKAREEVRPRERGGAQQLAVKAHTNKAAAAHPASVCEYTSASSSLLLGSTCTGQPYLTKLLPCVALCRGLLAKAQSGRSSQLG